MKFLLLLVLSVGLAYGHEKERKTKADFMATAHFTSQKNHPWPFPLLSIGHNMQSFQNYGDSPYWHDGLDIRSQVDQAIYASVGGKVVNIENYVRGNLLYWEIAILDEEGFVWKYHHVERKSIPAEIFEAYKTGKTISSGTLLGNVVKWPTTTFGEVYHHLHLLVVGGDGQYINPLLMMEPLPDTSAPVIRKIGLAKNHRALDTNTVKGPHSLFIETSDLILHDKFILPPHKISYRLNGGETMTVWEFVNLPSGKNDTDYIEDFYLDGTCGNYRCRKIYINLNFTKESPRGVLNLPAGNHHVEVTVEDLAGNKATNDFQWQVL